MLKQNETRVADRSRWSSSPVFVTAGGMFFATSVELSHQLETREYETGRDHIRTLGVVFEDHFSGARVDVRDGVVERAVSPSLIDFDDHSIVDMTSVLNRRRRHPSSPWIRPRTISSAGPRLCGRRMASAPSALISIPAIRPRRSCARARPMSDPPPCSGVITSPSTIRPSMHRAAR